MPTSPTAPSAVPDFPAIGDASYNSKAYAWATHMDATYPAEMQALATNAYDNAVEANADATTATTKAAEAVAASLAATTTANASAWVNGGTYALNANAISGVDFQTYRKKTASSVTTTDPSADSTNWTKLGGGSIGLGGTTSTASITLTAASPAAMTVTPATPGLYVTLPDATTCTKADNLYAVYNAGDYDYGVKDSAGTQLGWIRARTGAMIGLADNSTAAGVWAYYGLEKTGITASYVNSTLTNMSSTIRRIALDANRTCFLFGGTDCYAIVYDASTQTWGSATLVRATVAGGAFLGVLSATDQVLVCSCSSTTAFEAVTLSISSTTVTVNTGTKATATLAGSWVSFGQFIPVSTSWVVSYSRATTTTGIRALTVSGTTPTIGAESALTTATDNDSYQIFASGSVVRTIALTTATTTMTCKPFTVSGSTLSAGTAATSAVTSGTWRAFLNGNGNIVCQHIRTTHYATIFKLTGTTEAASSVNLGTAPTNITAQADYVQVTASKTAFLYSVSSTTWYANILTDTAGTASAGTEISSSVQNSMSAVSGISASGNNARFAIANSSQTGQVTLDCSGASPTVSTLYYVGRDTTVTTAVPTSSNVYGYRDAKQLTNGQTSVLMAGGVQLASMLYLPGRVLRIPGDAVAMLSTIRGTVSTTSNESFFADSLNNGTSGYYIQRVECAA